MLVWLDCFAVLTTKVDPSLTLVTTLVFSPHQATSCMSSSRLIILVVERDLRQGSTHLKQQVNHFVCHFESQFTPLDTTVNIIWILGEFEQWSEWGACSTTCGEGTRTRTRNCLGPYECVGSATQSELCNSPCPKVIYLIFDREKAWLSAYLCLI